MRLRRAWLPAAAALLPFLLPGVWFGPAQTLALIVAAGCVGWAASRETPEAGVPARRPPVRWDEAGAVGLAMLAAWALRWPRLETVPPGLWVDEAIQGLQGVAAWSGESLPDLPQIPYPHWPLWWVAEAAATRLLGATVQAIRTPAAIAGTLTVPLAWWVARSWTGPAGGAAAAWLVAGSFWHVQFSRMALEPILLPAEGLAVAWLLLAPRATRSVPAAGAAGVVAGLSCYGYAAALYLPLWTLGTAAALPGRRRLAACALGLALTAAPLALHGGARLGRPVVVGVAAPAGLVRAAVSTFANLLGPVPYINNGYWENHPAGGVRLALVERAAVLVGLAVLLASGLPRPVRWPMLAWLPLALAPEIGPAGLHLYRGLGALAPLALLAGWAGLRLGVAAPRHALAAIVTLGAANALATGVHYYGAYAVDPAVKGWFISVDVETARLLKPLCREAPIEVQPELTYAGWPGIRFLMLPELRAGRLRAAAGNPPFTRIIGIARHAVQAQPTMFLYGTDGYPRDRRVGLLNIAGLLAPGTDAEARGDPAGAERYYRHVLAAVPDAGLAHARLGLVLFKAGRRAEASRELARAVSLGVADPEVLSTLSASQPPR